MRKVIVKPSDELIKALQEERTTRKSETSQNPVLGSVKFLMDGLFLSRDNLQRLLVKIGFCRCEGTVTLLYILQGRLKL